MTAFPDDGVPLRQHLPEPGTPSPPPPAPGALPLRREARQALLVAVGTTVLGVLLGLLWLWLAPRVPLYSDGRAVYLRNPEGEEAMAGDGTFALIAAGIGVACGAVLYVLRRRGGVGLVLGLAAGGLLGSLLGWQLGTLLGPGNDLVELAGEAGRGATFDGPLELRAKGALLAWPFTAVAVHMLLTAAFTPREQHPPPAPPGGPWQSGAGPTP